MFESDDLEVDVSSSDELIFHEGDVSDNEGPPPFTAGSWLVSIGWLEFQDESVKIPLAGLIAAVSMNHDKDDELVASKGDIKWMNHFITTTVEKTLKLPRELVQGVIPLATMTDIHAADLARSLLEQPIEFRQKAVGELLALSVLNIGFKDERYDSRTHRCIRQVAAELQVDERTLRGMEEVIADLLISGTFTNAMSEDEELAKKSKSRSRKFKIGGAAALGAVLVGVTGGLAAPAIGASLAAWGGTAALGTFMASAGGVAVFTTMFAAAGGGLTGYKMNKRVGGKLSEFEFHPVVVFPRVKRALTASIFVSGWHDAELVDRLKHLESDQESIESEWTSACTGDSLGESFQLVWETKVLKAVAETLTSFAIDQAVGRAAQEVLKTTVLASFMAAIAWPSLILSASNIIDSNWAVGLNKSKIAGEELGRALMSGAHGRRPVTLIGYSLGAAVVFHALEYLCRFQKEADNFVLDVVLIGAPVTTSQASWNRIRRVTAGSVINCYIPNDWILMLLFRYSTISVAELAGLSPIQCPGVDNLSLSEIDGVSSTMNIRDNLPCIMKLVDGTMKKTR